MKIAGMSLLWFWRLLPVPGMDGIDSLEQSAERLTVTITFLTLADKRRFWGWLVMMTFAARRTRELDVR